MQKASFLAGVLFFSLLMCQLFSCESNQGRDIESYYFPISILEKEGKVYEYRSIQQDSLGSDYWYYSTLKEDDKTFFIGNYYDVDLNVRQFFREEKVYNGMLLREMFIYATDSLGKSLQIPVEIEVNNAYPFKVNEPSGIFLYKIKWEDPYDSSVSTTLIRNRRYLGDTTYMYQGKEYAAIQFELRELIESYKEGEGYAEPQYAGLEIYAKDLGLVYYRRDISDSFKMEYELVDIFPMKTLEDRFKQ